ncbi:MAG: hypothetical protein IJZ42_13135 [Lachnospiraceae bacterium]|nr:hypothetical protein [Lachnospiraceae bacterium]
MDKNLFRAKRTQDSSWIYGSLITGGKSCTAIYRSESMHSFTVLPETVGQFTGLTDKNGTKIFEGDIVDVEHDLRYVGVAAERIGLFKVVFDEGCFMKQNHHGLFHFIKSDTCTVVGNIYDNPELLKENKI